MTSEADASAGAAAPDSASDIKQQTALERFTELTGLEVRMVAMVAALALIWAGLAIFTRGVFISPRNLTNLSVQGSVVAIMATGMVMVIVARHIDLSVGSLLGLIGMIVAAFQVRVFPIDAAWGWPLAILIGLVLGAAIGVWQGYWVAYRNVPAFVVTLGGLLAFRGAAFLVSDGQTIAPLHPGYTLIGGGAIGSIGALWSWVVGAIGVVAVVLLSMRSRARRAKHGFPLKPQWIEWALVLLIAIAIVAFIQIMNSYTRPRSDIPRGIPIPVLILIVVVVVMTFIAKSTKFGRYVYAIGGNPEAAQLSGIDTRRTTLMIFVIMGVLSAIAGIVTSARLQSAGNLMGNLNELQVIAAAVIGGTSLAGGVGSIAGAVLGALVIFSIINGMVLLGASSPMQQIVLGLVLIAAVWFDVAYTKLQR